MIIAANSTDLLAPGAHSNIPFEDYCLDPGLNSSTLKHFHKSTPKHALHAMTTAEVDTEALRRGHAAHTAVLEPELYEKLFAAYPKEQMVRTHGHPNSNKYKAARDAWYVEHEDACIIDEFEWRNALEIRDALRDQALARSLLFENKGRNELTIIADVDGVRRKARVDRLTNYNGQPCIVDLKTISTKGYTLSPRTVEKQVYRFAYHVQMAWYLDTLNAVAPADRIAILAFVEADDPHDVVCYHVESDTIELGRKQYTKYLNQLLRGRKTGFWPGYSDQLLSMNFPQHILEEEGNL